MTNADDLNLGLIATEELAKGLGLSLNGAGRSLLNQNVPILTMLKGKEDQVDGLVETLNETGHRRLGKSDMVPVPDLVQPEWMTLTRLLSDDL